MNDKKTGKALEPFEEPPGTQINEGIATAGNYRVSDPDIVYNDHTCYEYELSGPI